ncbi:diguanylate cyclase (GGDEF)-like protein [Kineococcus xinjiangensis]|uniref:Diguanylate cyclase (GGDEF)-like protein n=1 Tax=Kineococcus xinjiangensis TaxID=512762 RepID=A0A2S6IG74_9ACTN|nr:GGDEF domain-containing protein [Kineococcus xinjiangensis]PPK93215.1 diguanylate cyclase (GGDEF)-like protein [Kineococcus xinjiangensis]
MQTPPRPASRWAALLHSLGPRHPRSARVWAAVVLVATTVISVATAVLARGGLHTADVVAAVVLTAFSVALVVLPPARTVALTVLAPVLGVVATVLLDLATSDATITGQVFFCLPVLWAATQLRVGGAALVTAAAVVGEAVVVLSLLPQQQALNELAYMSTVLLLTGGLLARGSMLQDRLVARLRQQASVDPLTGLVTRRVLDDATRCALTGAGARTGTALVIIDLDRFKSINDTHGHLAGDAALAHVAGILGARCREQDVVARMGGDELAVLMPGCDPDVAARRAEQIVTAVRETPLLLPGGVAVRLSISAGVAHVPHDATGAQELYASADAALYVAKRGGRDQVGRPPAPAA